MVMLTLGTGVGGGLILDGHLYRGAIGAAAGARPHHLDLNGPPCQGAVRAAAISRRWRPACRRRLARACRRENPDGDLGRARQPRPQVSTRACCRARFAGPGDARDVLSHVGFHLGVGIATSSTSSTPSSSSSAAGSRGGRAPARPRPEGRVRVGPFAGAGRGEDRSRRAWVRGGPHRLGARRVRRPRRGLTRVPLVVCATPIGNLEDVTLRVLRELAEADLVLCEDTRRTRILLDRHGVRAQLLSLPPPQRGPAQSTSCCRGSRRASASRWRVTPGSRA